MFTCDDLGKVHERAMSVIEVLDGLTVNDAQFVLKQAEAAILGAQRVLASTIRPAEALEVIRFELGVA